MSTATIPKDYLNSLATSAIVVKDDEHSLNHQIAFINTQFIREIGYTLTDIPDKDTWWRTAYPDETYQHVVARQWELAIETFNPDDDKYVVMDVEIQTKRNGAQKYRVYSQGADDTIPGHYVVMFEMVA